MITNNSYYLFSRRVKNLIVLLRYLINTNQKYVYGWYICVFIQIIALPFIIDSATRSLIRSIWLWSNVNGKSIDRKSAKKHAKIPQSYPLFWRGVSGCVCTSFHFSKSGKHVFFLSRCSSWRYWNKTSR